ncbi:hypothetical protein BJV82DRAFT_29276 [Fennellomyces sp. T-0311]|nr:hypothetical protein BJV82DRAFT_29276 [Fennellomyces sp. T-0311]
MSDHKAKQGITIKQDHSNMEGPTVEHLKDSASTSDPGHVARESQGTESTDMSTTKHEKDASTTKATEEQLEWHPISHPKLPITTPPCYFVNKRGDVCSISTGKHRLLRQVKGVNTPTYALSISKYKTTTFKLREIMVYTFLDGQFDKDEHYIFHKDGQQKNCALANLLVSDLSTLQQLEIARLENLHPNTRYTVVRNIHDTSTFEHYLVSDNGDVYSLVSQKHLKKSVLETGYQIAVLSSDNRRGLPKAHVHMLFHSIVLQSFNGRPMVTFILHTSMGTD